MSTSLTTKNIYKEYEKQLASLPGPTSYATIIAGYSKNTTIAPSILKTPFYAGVVEIGLFADELIKLADSSMSIAATAADLADFLSTVPNVPDIFIPKTFDIDLIIDSVEFSFSITEAAEGLCGKTIDIPATLIGAVNNVIQQIQKNLVTQIINFMDRVNIMFAVPTRMVNNILKFIDDTNEEVKAPFQEERDRLTNTLKNYRRELKITNDPVYIEYINNQMNQIGILDRYIRDLIMKLKALENAVAQFLIHLENASKLGFSLVKNIQYIVSNWQKDSVCVQVNFDALIKAII